MDGAWTAWVLAMKRFCYSNSIELTRSSKLCHLSLKRLLPTLLREWERAWHNTLEETYWKVLKQSKTIIYIAIMWLAWWAKASVVCSQDATLRALRFSLPPKP
jgi:hypothetical protein